ncbi:HNH endonuclease [Microbacterium testaceum]|uniref:HNH endonuclease n=1 Tax=Microbacterium testaceum TaxID=2033 RepID=UPI000AEE0E95|nr:HNH endonuclease [Microbacterium testaceum]
MDDDYTPPGATLGHGVVAARKNTRRMHELRTEFFDEGKRLDAEGDPDANCHICKARIDYDAAPGTTPESHNLDHYYPVSTHPELQEDWDNFRHAHTLCNQTRGNGSIDGGGLGELVPDWW